MSHFWLAETSSRSRKLPQEETMKRKLALAIAFALGVIGAGACTHNSLGPANLTAQDSLANPPVAVAPVVADSSWH